MKWLLVALLWVLAAAIAIGVVWRIWRGKPVLLRGKWTPRVVRMVAVFLVVLGIGQGKTEAAPAPVRDTKSKPGEELPPAITPNVLEAWTQHSVYSSEWGAFKQTFTLLMQTGRRPTEVELNNLGRAVALNAVPLTKLLAADLKAMQTGQPAPQGTVRELLDALDGAERGGYIDPWVMAYVWRKTAGVTAEADRKPLADLFARLHRHARLANVLIACRAHIRPFMEAPIPWRGKAARPKFQQQNHEHLFEFRKAQLSAGLINSVKQQYPKSTAGTWETEGLLPLTVAAGSPPVTPIRAGEGLMPRTSGTIHFGRLDLLETVAGDKPAKLSHPLLGEIEVPAGRLVSVWDLPGFLSAASKETLKKLVAESLSGSEKAAGQLEKMLPLAQPFIREGLRQPANAQGAPRLRLILTQFDDVPVQPGIVNEREIFQGGRGRFPEDFPRIP